MRAQCAQHLPARSSMKIDPVVLTQQSTHENMLRRQMDHIDKNVADSRKPLTELKVPNLTAMQGDKFVPAMDSFMEQNAGQFSIIKHYTHLIGHHFNPDTMRFWEPPTKEDKYGAIHEDLRTEYEVQSRRLWTAMVAKVPPCAISRLMQQFGPELHQFPYEDEGALGERFTRCIPFDGVYADWCILCLYRQVVAV